MDEDTTERCQFCEFYNAVEDVADFTPSVEVPENIEFIQNIVYIETYEPNTFSSTIYPGIYYNLPPPVLM